jgi:hypothetical protein
MKNRRIIYFLRPYNFPSGGVAVIYQHVEILAKNGFNAYVALSEKPTIDFYNSKAPLIIHSGKFENQKGDIYVFPEGYLDYMNALRKTPAKKIMFCQNQYYMPFTRDSRAGFSEYPVDSVIVSSEAVKEFMQDVYGLSNTPIIPCSLDKSIYFPKNKKRQIAFMPRKLPTEAAFLEATFKRMHPKHADIPWISIEGKNREDAAEILRESEIFISLSHLESFGLPPLEAMACGCLVSGFHGDGGREYMNERNGWWVDAYDWRTCLRGVVTALQMIDENGEALRVIKSEMDLTVENYSIDHMKERLLSYWTKEVSTSF